MANKIKSTLSDARTYWNTPMPKRFIPFKETAGYSFGGIGAYFIVTMATTLILGTGNVVITGTLGVDQMDMYIMYVIAVLANVPLTGIRAKIIDNTRNKAGKYRPYILTMAVPTAIICILMVWFPYNILESIAPGVAFVKSTADGPVDVSYAYIIKCALILLFNLLLNFFYYFFYDSYENLIHVLSPNSQERTDVVAIKSVVYSFAPTVYNLIAPFVAGTIFKSNMTDIRVYRVLFPILAILGILLLIIVYKSTTEKIVQARSHVVSISFIDALRAVSKNKYFWIISLAGWIGFLEIAYQNILYWLYNYGGVCTGPEYGIINTLYGNASLWGMILAPFCIRKWGKKAVLIVTNFFNIVFILMMLPFTQELKHSTIWLVMMCLWFNALMGSFAHVLNPAIQADIRDYQQYKTGERIDGMFSAVGTIGTVLTLATSSVLPYINEVKGMTRAGAMKVTSNPEILGRMLGDGKTVGQVLAEQYASGQNNYEAASSALYDPSILLDLLHVLIIVSAIGAAMNVIPFFWYDFNEKKQKSVIRVLQVRALFEDYGNGVLKDSELVEAIDIIRSSREYAALEPIKASKKDYKSIKDSAQRFIAKKTYKEALKVNDEIEISKFVCDELDKFSNDKGRRMLEICNPVYAAGLSGLKTLNPAEIKAELKAAKKLSKETPSDKEVRSFAIEMARNKKIAYKTIRKHFADTDLVQPDFMVLDALYDRDDECDAKMKKLYLEREKAKKAKMSVSEIDEKIKKLKSDKAELHKQQKAETEKHVQFNRAAKPYVDAEHLFKQKENFAHFEDIAAQYEEAKARAEAEKAEQDKEQKRLEAEKQADKERKNAEKRALKEQKAAEKKAKKNK